MYEPCAFSQQITTVGMKRGVQITQVSATREVVAAYDVDMETH